MNGLKSDYEDRTRFEFVKTTTERGKTEPKEYGLGSHGMVLLSGEKKILWKKPGHKIKKEEIVSGLSENLPK